MPAAERPITDATGGPRAAGTTRRRALSRVAGAAWAGSSALAWLPALPAAAPPASATGEAPARVLMLGLFHFDNPGLDAVKYQPLDVMQPGPQADLAALVDRLVRFAPTRVLLEYPESQDAVINRRYADYRAGGFELPASELYQLGFRVAHRAGLSRVHGFDAQPPPTEVKLWDYLREEPAAERRVLAMIEAESRRLQALHRTHGLRQILQQTNTDAEDRRNKGLYLQLNAVGAARGLFHGADASAHWWHRNLRMYARMQQQAAPGERVLVLAGSGHVAILRELLRSDPERVEEDVQAYLR